MAVNCNCSDATGYRNLGQLRVALFNALGFVDPLANVGTRSLLNLRNDLLARGGSAAMVGGTLPPGIQTLLDGIINEAQQILWRRLELDKGADALPARMTADGDLTTLDYVPVQNLALAMYKAHKGLADAKVYFEVTEKFLSDTLNRRPPNAVALCNDFITNAQRLLIRDYTALRMDRWFSWPLTVGQRFYDYPDNAEARQIPTPVNDTHTTATTGGSIVAGTYYGRISAINANGETLASTQTSIIVPPGTSTNTITWKWLTPTVPGGVSAITGYKIYGRATGAELLIATVGVVNSYLDTGAITPAGALPTANTTADCDKTLDQLNIKWVGATRGTIYFPLHKGIPNMVLGYQNINAWPQFYELKQCIEIWPAPTDTLGTLMIRSGFNATAFTADADLPSVDDELVYLLALVNAKAHFKQADTGLIQQQFDRHLRNIVAGGHATARYIPGRDRDADMIYTAPAPTVPWP